MHKILSMPTLLTLFRIIIVPFFMVIYYIPDSIITMMSKNFIATGVFLLAALTDYLDGYLARKLSLVTRFGEFLDPVADKALVAASLVVLVHLGRTFVFAAIIIIIREIAISALREWLAQFGSIKSMAVTGISKVKTACQMLAIILLLLDYHSYLLGNFLMLIAVVLTIISMLYYLEQSKKHFL